MGQGARGKHKVSGRSSPAKPGGKYGSDGGINKSQLRNRQLGKYQNPPFSKGGLRGISNVNILKYKVAIIGNSNWDFLHNCKPTKVF
ncbi:hypothetical protein GCM10027284_00500 [Cyclobacterium sediminis]